MLLALMLVMGLNGQTVVFDDSPNSLRVGESLALGAYLQADDGFRRSDGLVYSTDTPDSIQVSPEGFMTGLRPGESLVTVTDPESQATATWALNVVPARLILTPGFAELIVGETLAYTVDAFDVNNSRIAGLTYRFSTSLGQVARMDGAKATALAPGQAFVTAQLEGLSRGGGTFATASLRINPKPLYTTKPLISAATVAMASPISFSKVVSSNNRTAVIAGFDNGGQAALLLDGASQKVLIASGQSWGEVGSVVLRLNGVSINRQGDAAVLVELSDIWCSTAILIFQQKGPVVEIPTGCNGQMGPKALAQDGSIIYYQDSSPQGIFKRTPNGDLTTILQRNIILPVLGKIRDFQQMTPGSDGTMLAQLYPETGQAYFAVFDGTRWIRAFAFGEIVAGSIVNDANNFFSNGAGQWYFLASGNGFRSVAAIDNAGKTRFVLRQQNQAAGEPQLGWPHRILDADGTNVLLMAGVNVENKYNDWLCWLKPSGTIQAIQPSHWDAVREAAITPTGPVLPLVADNLMKLQKWNSTFETVLSASAKLAVPAATEWRYLRFNNRDGWLRGGDDGFFRASDSRGVLLPGQKLPTQQSFVVGGLSASHPNGWTAFAAISQNSQGVFLNGNGRTTILADTAMNTLDVQNRRLEWLDWGPQNSRMSVNSRGDVAYGASFGGTFGFVSQKQGELMPRMLLSNSTPLPAGAGTMGWTPRVDLDDSGELRFLTYPAAGGAGIYQATGTTVRALLSTRDPFDGGTIQGISGYCSRNGNGFAALDGGPRGTLLALSNGGPFAPVDFGLPERGGVAINGLPGNFCDVSPAGEIYFAGQTSEGRIGIFHYSPVTRRVRAVLFTGQKLSDGATLIQPYQISVGPAGSFFFAAHVYSKQGSYLAVYEAIPLP